MDKRASIELVILGVVAVIAVVGLVLLFTGKLTGKAAGQPVTRQVLVTPEDWRVERPGGYTCGCSGTCVYDGRTESASAPITAKSNEAAAICKSTLEKRCAPQPLVNFKHTCATR